MPGATATAAPPLSPDTRAAPPLWFETRVVDSSSTVVTALPPESATRELGVRTESELAPRSSPSRLRSAPRSSTASVPPRRTAPSVAP